jgi:phosphomannomutase/phosphoglucomutase
MKEIYPVVNPYIFRMYDIRGIVDQDLTIDVARLIGLAYGTFVRQSSEEEAHIAVGKDNRPSSSKLHSAVCTGLIDAGCNILDVGLTPSPVLSFAVARWGLDGGINVTGSHNPLDQNGFKLEGRNAYPIAEEDIQQIRELIEKHAFAVGKGAVVSKDPKKEYMAKLLELVIVKRPIKVVADAGNGVAGLYAPTLLRQIGCEVVELYCELDSRFPHHLPNPEDPSNMRDLQQRVVDVGADMGVAYDGDADRIGVVNERGERVASDHIIILLSRDLLVRHPGAKVLMDVKSSQTVVDDVIQHGGVPILWKTGHSLIRRKMHQDGILFAGEFSGHMYFAEDYYTIDDAILASCRLLQILSEQRVPLSGLLRDVPKRFSTGLIEAACSDRDKFEVVTSITDFFSKEYNVLTIDGVRIMFGDGWALVRASNTTPTLTLRFEANSQKRLKEIESIIYSKLKEFPSVRLPSFNS